MWKKLSARAAASAGLLLILAGLVGASLAPSASIALASASESAGLYGACGSIGSMTPGCGGGTCWSDNYTYQLSGDGNVSVTNGQCSYFNGACGTYSQQVNFR